MPSPGRKESENKIELSAETSKYALLLWDAKQAVSKLQRRLPAVKSSPIFGEDWSVSYAKAGNDPNGYSEVRGAMLRNLVVILKLKKVRFTEGELNGVFATICSELSLLAREHDRTATELIQEARNSLRR